MSSSARAAANNSRVSSNSTSNRRTSNGAAMRASSSSRHSSEDHERRRLRDAESSSQAAANHGTSPLMLNRPYHIARSETMGTVQAEDTNAGSFIQGGIDGSIPFHEFSPPRNRSSGHTNPYIVSEGEEDEHEHGSSAYISSNTGPRRSSNTNAHRDGTYNAMVKNGAPSSTKKGQLDPSPPCLNPVSEVNARLDTQVEVKVYPCNNSSGNGGKRKFTTFTVRPEGVIIQGTNRHRPKMNDLGTEYARHVGRSLQRYELTDTRACQLLVTTHNKSFWVVPAPEAFSRHSGTCRLLGDRKHPLAPHTLQVGDFLRVGSVGVVVIETHNGIENRVLSEEKIQKIMKDTTNTNGNFLDLVETDGENSEDESVDSSRKKKLESTGDDSPVCYMCFDDENSLENPLITPCKCRGDTRYVHVNCLRKWHTAEADNQVCFLSSVDATCSVCKSTFKSDFKLKDGRLVKLFKSSLEPPYVSLLVATKHEMAQRLFNTRFQLSFSTLMRPDGKNATRPLLLGRSSGSDMVLDYRTVSARHASIKFKNGEFIFTDASSSNGSYLYLRRPVELTASQSVQFRLGRSMISMKVVNKWNRRLLRAVRRGNSSGSTIQASSADDHSVGSNDDDVRITDGKSGEFTRTLPRRSRESIMNSLPAPGMLSQQSAQHLDLLYALAYPKRSPDKEGSLKKKDVIKSSSLNEVEESKMEEELSKVTLTENSGENNSHFATSGQGEVTRRAIPDPLEAND
eukprot:CAMPEP_0184855252 /NCGR_PEP_ID=MMETSP0580-20130426/552_1 /TAXON_ID=1118495 /ORGANISM="Dactyliosolen fragilissimus" /LENGTH=738 /DNA_ID=CAMNT_0027349719 /DNA_START=539 /DNA_END=2755 /DNA_ORIENTATION=+